MMTTSINLYRSCLAVAVVCGVANLAIAGDWPQFLGPTRNGVYAENDISTNWPAAGPSVVWKMDVGQGFAGPAIADGKLILFDRVDDKERASCLEAKTGKPIWSSSYATDYRDSFGFDEGPRATPTISGAKLYTFGAAGVLKCWDFITGKIIWTIDTAKDFGTPQGFFGRVCSPLIEGNALIINVGARQAGIVAFDKDTGKVLWKATDDAASYSSPVAADINGKRYLFVLTRSGLETLDPITGHLYFSFPFRSRMEASVNAATPLVVGDQIFLSASYGTGAALLKFDEKRPQKIWSGDDILSNHYATSVAADGFLYGFDGRQERGPNLRCVELNTGKVRWSEDQFGAGTILLVGKNLLVLTEKGELLVAPAAPGAFKPTSRSQILDFQCRAYPAIANGLFYARSEKTLVCVDLRVAK